MKLFKRAEFWLGLLIAGQISLNFVWLWINKTPPAWDEAAHLRIAVLMAQKLSGENVNSWTTVIRAAYGYPPLVHFLGGLWGAMWGINIFQITFLQNVFLAGLLVGVYKLGEKVLVNKWWALGVAVLVSLVPVVYELSRTFLLDLSLMMWVVWGLWSYLESDNLRRPKYALLWAGCLTLAAMTKLNGFIYFVPMGLWAGWQWLKSREEKIFINLLIAGIILILGVGWWWVINFQNIVAYLTGLAGQGEPLTDPTNLIHWQTWIHYFKLFFWNQLTPLAALIMVFLAVYFGKDKVKNEEKRFLFLFVLINYFVFTLIKNKDYRFTMPLLPVVMLWVAGGLKYWQEKNKEVFRVLGGILGIYLVWFLVNNSFNWPIKKNVEVSVDTWLLGAGDIVNISDYPVRSAKMNIWPTASIMEEMLSMAKERGKQKAIILINSEQINDNNLKLYRELVTDRGEEWLQMDSVFEENFTEWGNYNLVVVGEKDLVPAPFYATNLKALTEAKDFVWLNQEKFEIEKVFKQPDGKKIYLMRII